MVVTCAVLALDASRAHAQTTERAVTQEAATADKRYYAGVGIPFQGLGFYKQQDNGVTVWNLTPLSIEAQVTGHWGARFSICTVYSTPQPRSVGEFDLGLEAPYYLFHRAPHMPLSGAYLGPALMLQLHDQDSGASLGGPGVTLGWRGAFSEAFWYRIGFYLAYHRYLFGPKQALLEVTGGAESGGVFIGLTLFEVGVAF